MCTFLSYLHISDLTLKVLCTFTDEETDAQRLSNLLKVIYLLSSKAGFGIQMLHSYRYVLLHPRV